MDWQPFDWKSQRAGRKGEVLKKNVYKCAFCNGAGTTSKKLTRCPVCLGKGTVRVKAPAVICAFCGGLGRSYLNSALYCLICRGKGVVGIKPLEDIEICPTCKGMGREKGRSLPCMDCGGKGVIARVKREEAVV